MSLINAVSSQWVCFQVRVEYGDSLLMNLVVRVLMDL